MSYPHCNSPEYTPDLFSPRRPLRARTGSMEDIVAFLISKIEGSGKNKSILGGMYPCLQPSDSVGFRTNAAKYMEALRSSVIRPVPVTSTPNDRAPKTAPTSSKIANSQSSRTKLGAPQEPSSRPVAWWWLPVVVRKSLLEECTGERFEKMLLALSTHALSVQIPQTSPLHPTATVYSASSPSLLREQPREYATILARAFDTHTQNVQAVTQLNTRTQELLTLRARLALAPNCDADRPDTKRILAVRASKLRDLVDAWATTLGGDPSCKDGGTTSPAEDVLKWLMVMAGVSGSFSREEHTISDGTPQSDMESIHSSAISAIDPLPTASAHHPANIHKLRSLPTFITNAEVSYTGTTTQTPTSPALTALLEETASLQASLRANLDASLREQGQLKSKLTVALAGSDGLQTPTRAKEALLDLWDEGNAPPIGYEIPVAHSSEIQGFLEHLNIVPSKRDKSETQAQRNFEDRVLAMRDSIQPAMPSPTPPYVEVPQPESPPTQTKRTQSKLPLARPALKTSSPQPVLSSPAKHAPRTPRPYETSTPPIKTRSRSARKAALQDEEIFDDSPLFKQKSGHLEIENHKQVDDDSPKGDGLRTPTAPRGSIPLQNLQTASHAADLIADMSLPDFSDGDLTGNVTLRSESSGVDGGRIEEELDSRDNNEVPYEGHSITLRDILLHAGNGENVFRLIGEDDLEEDIGDETLGWD